MEVSNVKAMRDALELCHRVIHCAIVADILRGDDTYDALKKSKAALTEPPRNCDVGTAKEQMQRFMQFCDPHKNCENCPCKEADECKLTWAQMPYESEADDTTEAREEPEFKPCPFCGSTDIYHYRTDFGSADSPYVHVIRCEDCNASIYAKSGKYKDSIKLWNREAKESEVDNENNEKK